MTRDVLGDIRNILKDIPNVVATIPWPSYSAVKVHGMKGVKCVALAAPIIGLNVLLWRFAGRYWERLHLFSFRRLRPSSVKQVEVATKFRCRDLVVVRNIELGPCLQWTPEKLLSRIDRRQTVSVHRSKEPNLDFVGKNFTYEVLTFEDLLQKVNDPQEEEFWYYRATDPKRKAVQLGTLFPLLAGDIELPAIPNGAEIHSTVLRLGSPRSQVWLHYDVLDNILCQVLGTKRVILFDPKWAGNLYLNGSSSELGATFFRDIEQTLKDYPLFAQAWENRVEVVLQPGDALAIPAFWCHATQCLSERGMTCSVNAFYVLAPNELNGSDAWANKDPKLAQDATKLVAKAKDLLRELPLEDQRTFFRAVLQRELVK